MVRVVLHEAEHSQLPEVVQEELVVDVSVGEDFTGPLETLPMALFEGVVGRGPTSPLTCTPIQIVGPPMSPPALALLGEGVDALSQPSRWVAQ